VSYAEEKICFIKSSAGSLILVFGAAAYYVYFALPIGTGYTAKYLCSSVFITGRGEEETFEEDILPGR